MKALFLLAATSLSAIAVIPHMPDMATIKNEVNTLAANVPNPIPQISKLIAPAQSDQTATDQATPAPQADPSTQAGDGSNDSSTTSAPFVAKASPDDVERSYGQPEHVERTVYGETWYYPVYIFYFRNGYVERTLRSRVGEIRTSFNPTTRSFAPRIQPEPWRFSNHSSLGTSTLNGNGVQRWTNFGPRQTTAWVPPTTSSIHSTNNPPTFHSTGLGASTCNRPTQTTTNNYHPPVVQHTAPVQRSAPVAPTYGRVGY